MNQKNISSKLKSYIKQLGVSKYASLKNVKENDGKYTAEYIFKVDNNPLFSSKLEFVVSKEAACTENGEERANCTRCDYFETN